jgi:hypothetical protein
LQDKFLVIECVINLFVSLTVHHSKPPSIQVSERTTNALSTLLQFLTCSVFLNINLFPLFSHCPSQECLHRQENGYKTRYTHTHTHTSGLKNSSLHFLLNSAPGLWLLVSPAATACKHHPNGC